MARAIIFLSFVRPDDDGDEHSDIRPKTHDFDCEKIRSSTAKKCRPIKITVASLEVVKRILSKSNRLKSACGDADEYWRNINLAPDREKYERTAH